MAWERISSTSTEQRQLSRGGCCCGNLVFQNLPPCPAALFQPCGHMKAFQPAVDAMPEARGHFLHKPHKFLRGQAMQQAGIHMRDSVSRISRAQERTDCQRRTRSCIGSACLAPLGLEPTEPRTTPPVGSELGGRCCIPSGWLRWGESQPHARMGFGDRKEFRRMEPFSRWAPPAPGRGGRRLPAR